MQEKFLFAVLLPIVLLCSCRLSSGRQEQEHPRYFIKILDSANHLLSTQPDKALSFIDSAFAAFPHPGPIDLLRKYDFKRGYFQNDKRDYSTALAYADSALAVFRDRDLQMQFAEFYGSALYEKGDVLAARKDYGDAYLYYYQGKVVIEQAKDTCAFFQYNDRLGISCYNQGLYREAAAYFNESFGALSRCGDAKEFTRFVYQQRDLNNIGLSYTMMGKPDSAFYYYDSTLQYIAHNKNRFTTDRISLYYIETARGVVYGSEGDAACLKGDTALTEALYKKSIQINRQPGHDRKFAELTEAKLAGVYLASDRRQDAAIVLKDLKSLLDSVPSQPAQMNYLEQQWHYYDRARQPEIAYRYLLAYIHGKDSTALDGKQIAGQDMQGELKRIAGENQLNLLEKQNQLEHVFLLIALVFSLMTVAIILLVAQNSRRARRHVSELTQLNQRISLQNDHMRNALFALEQSHQENTHLVKVIAHDLRNPIGACASAASLMLEEPAVNEDHRHMLELIRASSLSSLEMINNLLHSNISKDELIKEPLNLQTLLKYCEEQLRFRASEKKQTILLNAQPITLSVSREKMWRVFSNLITNAIKFSQPGASIRVDLRRVDKDVLISVRDQGIGIPADIGDKIFDLFTESKRPGTSGEESFGLGLSISRQIVEAHGGRIWFESREGKGTTFFVSLPDGPKP
jgi:signal transduction histidine kinase